MHVCACSLTIFCWFGFKASGPGWEAPTVDIPPSVWSFVVFINICHAHTYSLIHSLSHSLSLVFWEFLIQCRWAVCLMVSAKDIGTAFTLFRLVSSTGCKYFLFWGHFLGPHYFFWIPYFDTYSLPHLPCLLLQPQYITQWTILEVPALCYEPRWADSRVHLCLKLHSTWNVEGGTSNL